MPHVGFIDQGPVVQGLDNDICQINHYPVDKCWQNKLRHPLDSDLSVDSIIHLLNNWGQFEKCRIGNAQDTGSNHCIHTSYK